MDANQAAKPKHRKTRLPEPDMVRPIRLYGLAYACRLYGTFTEFDSSIKEFRRETAQTVDLENQAHRKALLVWLNSWGCRQFAKEYHRMASEALLEWGGALPGPVTSTGRRTEPACRYRTWCRHRSLRRPEGQASEPENARVRLAPRDFWTYRSSKGSARPSAERATALG